MLLKEGDGYYEEARKILACILYRNRTRRPYRYNLAVGFLVSTGYINCAIAYSRGSDLVHLLHLSTGHEKRAARGSGDNPLHPRGQGCSYSYKQPN